MDVLAIAMEASLTNLDRKKLKDSDFGLPKKRKYPLYVSGDDTHLRNAIAFFHFCAEEDRKELAKNIITCIKKTKSDVKIGSNNLLLKYTNVPQEMIRQAPDKKKVANESLLDSFILQCDNYLI